MDVISNLTTAYDLLQKLTIQASRRNTEIIVFCLNAIQDAQKALTKEKDGGTHDEN